MKQQEKETITRNQRVSDEELFDEVDTAGHWVPVALKLAVANFENNDRPAWEAVA